MRIEKIILNNYRNYIDEEIVFNDKINIIYGKNGQGKTNILEAIFLCSIGKSFRNARDNTIIKNGQEYYKINISFYSEKRNQEVQINYLNDKREILINGIKINKIGQLIGHIPAVVFSPEDLNIIKEGPAERRKFIDIIICQLNNMFIYDLQKYNKVIANRNILIREREKRRVDADEFCIWDKNLIEIGSKIILERQKYLKKLCEKAKKFNNILSNNKEDIDFLYNNLKKGEGLQEYSQIKEKLEKSLAESRYREEKYKTTMVGPHRDDIIILLNNIDIKKQASQGQQRTAVLSLKLAELELIKEENDELPVLLLDDVMSELDEDRRKILTDLIKDIQVIITSTEDEQYIIGGVKKIKIKSGKVVDSKDI